MEAKKEFYGVIEVAKILSLSRDRVYEYLRSGAIKGSRLTKTSAWRVHKDEINRIKRAGGIGTAKTDNHSAGRQQQEPPSEKNPDEKGRGTQIRPALEQKPSSDSPTPSETVSEPKKTEQQKVPISEKKTNPEINGGQDGTSAPEVATSAPSGEQICQAPPNEVNVTLLESWGVPTKKSGEILYLWRHWHREGRHDICLLFFTLRDDLTKLRFPFHEAEINLKADIEAMEFHADDFHQVIELGRKYRHWENPQKHATFMKEVKELSRPSHEVLEKKGEHLAEVGRLLELFESNVEMVLATQAFETTFRVETLPLFEGATRHCWNVWYAHFDVVPRRGQYQLLFTEITKEISKISPQGATSNFATVATRCSINLALGGKLPKFFKTQQSTNEWTFIVDGNPPITLAIGEEAVVDQCKADFVVLIQKYRSAPEIKQLTGLTKELHRFMLVLKKELEKVIEKRTYLETTCTECPR
jgi:hypothetical protein